MMPAEILAYLKRPSSFLVRLSFSWGKAAAKVSLVLAGVDALLTHENRLVIPSFGYAGQRRPNISVSIASCLIAIPVICVSKLLVVVVDAAVGQGALAAPVDLFVLRQELSGAQEDLI